MTRTDFRHLFENERAAFLEEFPAMPFVGLRITEEACPHPPCEHRDFASYDVEDHVVTFTERVLSLPIENVVGLIRHELGHAADEKIDEFGAEQRADDLAERATGERIYYDPHDVQTIAPGRYPRPTYLHR